MPIDSGSAPSEGEPTPNVRVRQAMSADDEAVTTGGGGGGGSTRSKRL